MGKIDIIVIGNIGSGKTSLINRFVSQESNFTHNHLPTLGVNLQKQVVQVDGQQVNVCIWDTAGQEKYFALTKNYIQNSDGVIIVFDITDKESFNGLKNYWYQQLQEIAPDTLDRIIIGNKCDLAEFRKVEFLEAQKLALEEKVQYYETSAKTGEKVHEAFLSLVSKCVQRIERESKMCKPKTCNSQNENNTTNPITIDDRPKRKNCFEQIQNMAKNLYSKIF